MNDDYASSLRLRKAERLHHRSLVNALYESGDSLYAYPLRLQYRRLTRQQLADSFRDDIPAGIAPVQMMITVPKRRQRHAVDRVLMRRRIREAYRLNRHHILDVPSTADIATLSLAFLYIADKKCSYARIERAVCTLLNKLQATLATAP